MATITARRQDRHNHRMADMEHSLMQANSTLMWALRHHRLNNDQTMANRRTDTILLDHKWLIITNNQIRDMLDIRRHPLNNPLIIDFYYFLVIIIAYI